MSGRNLKIESILHLATMDELESRRLLASAVVGNVLRVTGTSRGDDIFISRDADQIVVDLNGKISRFDDVARISVLGGAGNDRIEIDTAIIVERGRGNGKSAARIRGQLHVGGYLLSAGVMRMAL